MKRIFIAVDISGETRRKVSQYIEDLRRKYGRLRVGWEKTEKLHLTLKFLGDTDEKRLRDLIAAANETRKFFSPFKLQILQTGVFPNPRKARVLWLGVKDETNSLKKLNDVFESRCEKIGFEREKRNFSPHLTIARLREPEKSYELAETHLRENFFSDEFDVSEVAIYESRLTPGGSLYSIVSRHKFEKEI